MFSDARRSLQLPGNLGPTEGRPTGGQSAAVRCRQNMKQPKIKIKVDGRRVLEGLRRVPVPVRLPKWLVVWMGRQVETPAAMIEAALLKTHKLRAPKDAL